MGYIGVMKGLGFTGLLLRNLDYVAISWVYSNISLLIGLPYTNLV